MNNTTVTIKYANGSTREFIASDELEKCINEGEMFSVTTMHSDISIDEEMAVSKIYVGNPVAAMGHMMIMHRNAQNLRPCKKNRGIAEIIGACIGLLKSEITSHQSGMVSPVKAEVMCDYTGDDKCSHKSDDGHCTHISDCIHAAEGLSDLEGENVDIVTDGTSDRLFCHVIDDFCDYYSNQLDRNDDIAIEHCSHPENSNTDEGNCTSDLCPRYATLFDKKYIA